MNLNSLKDIDDRRRVLLKLNEATEQEFYTCINKSVTDVKRNAVKWVVSEITTKLFNSLGKMMP